MDAKDKLTHSLPFFSVVIPTYNVADYIKSTVESVFNQSYTDCEVIISDDGSKDETPNILKEIAARDSRVRIILQTNQGVSCARNAGIKTAKGDYIAFLDGDDLWADNHLKLAHDFFILHPDICWYSSRYETFTSEDAAPLTGAADDTANPEVVSFYDIKSVWTGTTVIKKTTAQEYEELFPLGIAIGEDVIAWHKIADKHPKLGKGLIRTAFYRIRENSAIRQNADLNTRVRQDAVLFRHLNEITPAEKRSRAVKKHFKHMSITWWVNKIMTGHTKPWFSYLWERRKMTGLFTTLWICLFVFLHCALIWIFSRPLLIYLAITKKKK